MSLEKIVSSVHPRSAFQHRDFRFYVSARFLALCAHQMLAVALGQHVYELTHNPLHLGYIGLALFFPKFGLTLIAGHTADRFDRRLVILVCRIVQWFCIMGIILFSLAGFQPFWILYALLLLMGTANAFDGPASQAIVPDLVPPEHFNNAVTWSSSIMQAAFIAGPALGGWLYSLFGKAIFVFVVVAFIRFGSILLISKIKTRSNHIENSEISLTSLFAGIHYVWKTKIILGTISLDLFAVLLGGAVALMPIFANDILHVGPAGLGVLRAAPSLGAAVMAISLAYLPPMKRSGLVLLWCVGIFGVMTIIFGLSENIIISLGALILMGGADMVSVVIRGILVQTQTPPAMRGRVSAVNLVFIGASNELGEFESGLTAAWFGVVPSVILGGLGTLAVVGLWTWKFPEIRAYKGT